MAAKKPTKPARMPLNAKPRTEERVAAILELISAGNSIKVSCSACGISHDTFLIWRKADPDLEARVRTAYAKAETSSIKVIRDAGEKDWRAHAWYLERTRPERYKERKQLDLSELPNDKIVAILEEDAGAGGGAEGAGAPDPAEA